MIIFLGPYKYRHNSRKTINALTFDGKSKEALTSPAQEGLRG